MLQLDPDEFGVIEGDEQFAFAPEVPREVVARPVWKVMIVDDEEEVHAISTIVLRDFEFEGYGLEFLSAYSGAEGMRLINENPDTAVMLLDVVMESDEAGLDVVKYIRNELQNRFVRIILRTGQPGEAPEKTIVANYDINDYKEKTELTSDKLTTSVMSAIRAYRDIVALESSRRGLERIICSSPKLFESQSLSQFCNGVLHQLTTLLNLENDALYAHASGFAENRFGEPDLSSFRVLAGIGRYSDAVGLRIVDLGLPSLIKTIRGVVESKTSRVSDGLFVAYFPTSNGSENVVCIQIGTTLSDVDKRLLGVFANNAGRAFDNLHLNNDLSQIQTELIYTLGGIIESRCGETGGHVLRVAEYSVHLATLLELPKREIEFLRLGAPLHDLGKVGIPDAVIHKKGALSREEKVLMRQHTIIGYKLLNDSGRKMLRTAALIALQHHEWWDGTGYPNGLVEEDAHIFARIVVLADVFDELTQRRPCKEAWAVEIAFEYIREMRGKQFDPRLVDVFLAHKEDFEAIMHHRSG